MFSPMDLNCANLLVSNSCDGRSYAHLMRSDLELLRDAPDGVGVDYFTRRHRDDAIILERGPAWAGLHVVDDHITGRELGETCVARPPARPSKHDASRSAGEDARAMALLGLAIGSRDELVDRVAGVLRGA
jgi:hypothetical protein